MKDIYVALSGASAAWDNLSSIAHNVANGHTLGFREARTTFELAGATEGTGLGAIYAAVGNTTYSAEDGELEMDDDPTHLALRGDGFFALQDGTFTRDGAFQLDPDGTLVTYDGTPVLSENGEITLQPGETFAVGSDGTITGSLSGNLGKLTIAGVTAWFVWAFVHIFFLVSFRNRVMVLLEWMWSYVRYAPGARLITGETAEYAARVPGRR